MATVLYFPSTTQASVSVTVATWDFTGTPFDRYWVESAPTSSAFTSLANTSAVASNSTTVMAQHISHPLSSTHDWTSTTFRLVMRGSRSGGGITLYAKAAIISNDGSTVHITGGLLSATGQYGSSTLTNATIASTTSAFGAYTNIVGDRIMVEVGYIKTNNFSRTCTLEIGDNSGSDCVFNTTGTTQFNPWFEVGHNVTFSAEGGGGPTNSNQLAMMGAGT